MSRTEISQTEREIFGAKFSDLVNNWKQAAPDGEKRTNEILAKKLYTTRSSLQKWCSGDSLPSKVALDIICNFFKVPEDHFSLNTATPEEKYKYVSSYATEIGKSNVEFAREIDLDLPLIRALSKLIDFDERFPIYSPISERPGILQNNYKYNRLPHKKTFAKNIDKDLNFLMLNNDDGKYIMHKVDLAYLKEVQDQIITFVEYLFYKRSKEMEDEVSAFNRDLAEVTVDGKSVQGLQKDYYLQQSVGNAIAFNDPMAFDKALENIKSAAPDGKSIVIGNKPVTWDYICQHDRFAKYTYSKDNQKEGK